MLYVIDKSIILFIYVNILFPKISLYAFPINKLVFLIAVILSFFYAFNKNAKVNKRAVLYILASFSSILFLALISVILGNSLASVGEFIVSVFILLVLPIFIFLSRKYDVERYLNHILIASTVLSIYVILIYAYFSQFPSWNPMALVLNESKVLATQLTYYKLSGLQVIVVMSGWLPLAMIISLHKLLTKFSIRRMACLVIILSALLMHKMLGLWVSVIVGVYLLIFLCGRFSAFAKLMLCVITVITIFNIHLLPEDFIDQKKRSLLQKSQQSTQALGIFSENLILGKGLGYIYHSSEIPALSLEESVYLESTYPMILSSTGLVGAFIYAFIFFYYVVRFLLIRRKGMHVNILFICYITILVAAIGNPYLWGGGLGLFFMCLLGAAIENFAARDRTCASG